MTIRELRKFRKMTVYHLSKKSGLSEKTIRDFEKDDTDRNFHIETIQKLADGLEISYEDACAAIYLEEPEGA